MGGRHRLRRQRTDYTRRARRVLPVAFGAACCTTLLATPLGTPDGVVPAQLPTITISAPTSAAPLSALAPAGRVAAPLLVADGRAWGPLPTTLAAAAATTTASAVLTLPDPTTTTRPTGDAPNRSDATVRASSAAAERLTRRGRGDGADPTTTPTGGAVATTPPGAPPPTTTTPTPTPLPTTTTPPPTGGRDLLDDWVSALPATTPTVPAEPEPTAEETTAAEHPEPTTDAAEEPTTEPEHQPEPEPILDVEPEREPAPSAPAGW